MNDERITAGEFARLMSLPESDPERRRAEGRPEFAAMKAMLAEFEAEEPETSATASIRDELARRVLPRVTGGEASVPPGSAVTPARPLRPASPGPFGTLLAALGGPAGRWSAAFAALALVLGIGWWSTARRGGEDVIRGERPPGAFEVRSTLRGGKLVLAWTAVPGADGYRAILLGPDLAEAGRIDLGAVTERVLEKDELPAALAAGTAASIEIQALKSGEVISTTPARAIRLP